MRVHFNWKLTLFVVLFFPVLLRLGFWQLDRAGEKQQMLEAHQQLVNEQALDVTSLSETQWQSWRPVILEGRFTDKVFLVDNQIYNGQFGYEVIQLMVLQNNLEILVSRGWVEGSLDRSKLPEVTTPPHSIITRASLYRPYKPYTLAELVEAGQQWPMVLPAMDIEKMYKQLGKNAKISRPFIARLDKDSKYVLTPNWQVVNVRPEKHTAYAIQWFAMAGLLIVLYGFASVRKTGHSREP